MASSRSSSPSLRAFNLRPSFLVKSLAILGVILLIISYSYWGHLTTGPANFIHRKPLPSQDFQFDSPTGQNWTHMIWQTSRDAVAAIGDEDRDHVKTWSDLNPEYRHEVLTDEMMESYVKEHFHTSHPDIENIYFEVQDYILRADLIRYLILLADGGVYNDLDVGCAQPIKTWVPPQYQDTAGILLGVEVDNKFGPDGRTFTGGEDLFQLVNWTIMSKPNQPFMWFLVRRVMDNIRKLAASKKQSISKMKYSRQEVLTVTGPAALTEAFFEYASEITSSVVTYHNFTKIRKPRLIGEVVILPIQAFGAGHQVRWAGWEEDGTELIHHYFAGSWKSDHFDEPVSTDEGQQEEEEKDVKEENEENEKATEEQNNQQDAGVSHTEVDKTTEKQPSTEEGASKSQENQEQAKDTSESANVGDTTGAQPLPESSGVAEVDATGSEVTSSDQDKQPANNKPASVQYVEDQVGKNGTTNAKAEEKESMMDKIEQAKTEMETKAKEDAEKEAQAKEDEARHKKEAAEAKVKALKEEAAKKEAEEKAKEQEESQMTDEEKETEDRKKKWAEVIAAAPKMATPKSEEEKGKTSNNLADYDFQPD